MPSQKRWSYPCNFFRRPFNGGEQDMIIQGRACAVAQDRFPDTTHMKESL